MNLHLTFVALVSAGLFLAPAAPQSQQPEKGKTAAPASAAAPKRVGDPYPFDACPISGGKLKPDSAVTKLYEGREVRFCCDNCPKEFEKDVSASFAKLDEKIIKDQLPLYPVKTSIITGKALPEKPVDFVYANRLVRVGSAEEKSTFLSDAPKHLAALDKAAIEAQTKNYPLKTCVSTGGEFDMGDPVHYVVAGRVMKLCCGSCKKKIDKDPAKFIAKMDDARKAAK